METTVRKNWLLDKLKENREQHGKCYKEAREGYIEVAQEKLLEKLEKLKEGKVTRLSFKLDVPTDHTSAYDTVIEMLEAHEREEVTLTAMEFRMFVQDEWDWMDSWLVANSHYSNLATGIAKAKGLV